MKILKNILSNKLRGLGWKNRFFYFLLFIFGTLTPFHFAHAFGFGSLFGSIGNILASLYLALPVAIVGFILNLIYAISVLFSAVGAAFLKWSLNVDIFLTKCADSGNCIVDFGWIFTRDLANMFFILILVAIAFAYILKLDTFGMKKALPTLLLVALLINFSQVFVGIIVDVSQIIMNTFTNALSFDVVLSQLGGFGGNISDGFKAAFSLDTSKQIEFLVQSVVLIIFNFVMGAMLFMYFLLFLVRIIALWIITMLAPLAFAALVLPQTKKYWSQWLGHLFQWSFLGVTALFFLFFGFYLLSALGSGYISTGIGDIPFGMTNLLMSILPYIVVIVFLFIGYQLAISSTPAMARGLAQGAMKFGRGKAMGLLNRGAGALAKTSFAGNTMEKMAGMSNVLGTGRLGGSIFGRTLGAGATWAVRKAGEKGLEYEEKQTQSIGARTAELKKKFGKNYKKAAATYSSIGKTDYQGKIAMGRYLTETAGAKGFSGLSKDQQKEVIKNGARYDKGNLVDIVKHAPGKFIDDKEVGETVRNSLVLDQDKDADGNYADRDLREVQETEGITDEKELIRKTAYKKATAAMKNIDIENTDKSYMDNGEVREAIAKWKPWSFIRKIADEWGSDMVQQLQDTAEEIDPGLESIAKTNPTFIKAQTSPMGGMFMRQWTDKNGKSMNNTAVNNLAQRVTRPQIPATLTADETTMLENTVKQMKTANQKRNINEIRTEVQENYRKKQKGKIDSQLSNEHGGLIRRSASNFGGDMNRAKNARMEELYENSRLRDSLSPLDPKASKKEIKAFGDIAEGTRVIPIGGTIANKRQEGKNKRSLSGALRSCMASIKEGEQNIDRLFKEILAEEASTKQPSTQQRATLSKGESNLIKLKNKRGTIRQELNKY